MNEISIGFRVDVAEIIELIRPRSVHQFVLELYSIGVGISASAINVPPPQQVAPVSYLAPGRLPAGLIIHGIQQYHRLLNALSQPSANYPILYSIPARQQMCELGSLLRDRTFSVVPIIRRRGPGLDRRGPRAARRITGIRTRLAAIQDGGAAEQRIVLAGARRDQD